MVTHVISSSRRITFGESCALPTVDRAQAGTAQAGYGVSRPRVLSRAEPGVDRLGQRVDHRHTGDRHPVASRGVQTVLGGRISKPQGRPRAAAEIRDLIRSMTPENPTWGSPFASHSLQSLGKPAWPDTSRDARPLVHSPKGGVRNPQWKDVLKSGESNRPIRVSAPSPDPVNFRKSLFACGYGYSGEWCYYWFSRRKVPSGSVLEPIFSPWAIPTAISNSSCAMPLSTAAAASSGEMPRLL